MNDKQLQKLQNASTEVRYIAICESDSSKEKMIVVFGKDYVLSAYRWYINNRIQFFNQIKDYL